MDNNRLTKECRERCRRYRRRILEISQQATALHIGSAFSCMEIVDLCYHELMQPGDTFIMSKGHGWLAQAVILEDLGVLDLSQYGRPGAPIGVHPDPGIAGIAAATGSLGHGLAMALGMAIADPKHMVYVVLSDGELQEGSTWEAVLQAGSMKIQNLRVFVDNNDLQSLGRTSETHPALYPIAEKFRSFCWSQMSALGHDVDDIRFAAKFLVIGPAAVVCKTVKGKGVSFMENQPIWHYRSPTSEEYLQALRELAL